MNRLNPTDRMSTDMSRMDRVSPDRMSLGALLVPMLDLNPLHWLGEKAKEGLADGWTAAMISLWSAGMWLMESVFKILDRFLTPDVEDPGLAHLYGVTLWISLLVAVCIAFGQIGLAAIRRDGASLGTLAIGVAQYGAVLTAWVAVCGGLVMACAGLTTGLLEVLLGIEDFSGYQTGAGWPTKLGGVTGSTALGMCSLFLLIPAAFGYVLIMLVREAGLLILTATMPIAAAGALSEGTKGWMWKSIRWFAAACLTAPLLALVLGIGVQITRAAFPDGPETNRVGPTLNGAAVEVPDSASQVGMAVVGSVVMVIACFCPMALFRLLAFVDPGTGSGASFRSAVAANGGVGGLLSGKGAAGQGSGAATQTASDGRAASEDSADVETANRFQSMFAKSFGARSLGVVGGAAARGMTAVGSVAQHGASMGVDVMGQAGFGSQGYYDTTPPARRGHPHPVRTRVGSSDHDNGPGDEGPGDDGPGGDGFGGQGVANLPKPPGGGTGENRPVGNGPAGGPAGGAVGGTADEAVLLA